ncbi:RluA family pseudouridine synthase [Demequina sp. TTPB684]|uniref:RluA family pseudouridine synthase n=1 Tax=unclassified Demequina TaxID=2620311 RepID=UPI001CF40AB9|nr:RluA family pseudouridine synthase [Demequina sp. TMPB413]MCB2412129.1 RluA family pseudouridine synthase [Demequina sp. TTPB684]UPU89555.1 RluA family pseudouridine synthase [Demequina sp. TMPB413]
MSDTRYLPVPDALVGERADVAIARMLGMSRTKAADLLDGGGVSLEGSTVGRSDTVREGILAVDLPQPRAAMPEPAIPGGLTVVYEDSDIAVIDKPVGVAAHPSPGWEGPTVTGALADAGVTLASEGAAERQGIVHRLDVGTSGLMVVAKSGPAYSALKRAFKERTIEKVYHAVAQGHLEPTQGTIDAPIGRHPSSDYKFAVVEGGRDSITHYEVLEMFPAASLVEVHLETGRTHQIRVHMAAMRHPLVGDLTYGADPVQAKKLGLTRQWLHAKELAFEHPTRGEPIRVVSEYPMDLAAALAQLRG